MSDKLISRREFLSRAATAGLGLLLSPAVGRSISFGGGDYYIVMSSDTHVGYSGANDTLESFVADVIENLRPNEIFCLGDLTHNAASNECQKYREFRDRFPVPVRECPGNHDHAPGLSNEDNLARFRDELGYDNHFYSYSLGNNVFIFLSDDRQKNLPAGLSYPGYMEADQVAWFEDTVKANQDRNVIVLSHQSPKGTTVMSEQPNMQMFPTDEIERILNTYRVDLWFSGHAHSGFDHKSAHREMFATVGSTTFVQVASICKCYSTNRVQSRFVSFAEGSKDVLIRSRNHETQEFDESLDVVASLFYPADISATAVEPEDRLAAMWGQMKSDPD